MCDKSSDDAPTDGCPPLPESLVHRLYAIPDGVVVGEEVGEREVEAHRRYQSELMKYRRTAKVRRLATDSATAFVMYSVRLCTGSVYCA